MRKFFYSLITGERDQTIKTGYPFPGPDPILYALFRPPLLILSFIYLCTIRLINFFYNINLLKSIRPKSKVISVGNITWGGTGKTNLVALLARFLDTRNKKCAVLIRGYGSDEDVMLKEQLERTVILSGKDRQANVRIAEDRYGVNTLILDDGFQHWHIRRDLDIVAISVTNPFGNRKVIPAGILREPISALKRADIIVLTKTNFIDKKDVAGIKDIILDVVPKAEIFEAEYLPVSVTRIKNSEELNPGYIADKRLCAIAGVGDNNSFFRMLLDLGAKITTRLSYQDHHKYTQRDIKDIINAAKGTNSDAIITTAKDWVRLKTYFSKKEFSETELLLLNVILKVADEERFFDSIEK